MKRLVEKKIQILKNLLSEAEWNFHHGNNHDMSPYGSETKYICQHETGQFGSGTYFSTYNTPWEQKDDMKNYGDNHPNKDPNFIQIDDAVYRVDFNLYKNLYRVYSQKQGDILHTMCSYLNSFYEKVSGCNLGRYRPQSARYDNSRIYQIIHYNSDSLGLKCPSYMELTRMAQKHAQTEDKQSFSTVFMEWNGFNGVNVSGVDTFDNSRHGSVIYDLSKTSMERVPMGQTGWFHDVGGYHTNTIATKSWDNKDAAMIHSLNGELYSLGWDELTDAEKLRILKNIFNSPNPHMNADDVHLLIFRLRDSNPKLKDYLFKQLFDTNKVDSEITLDFNIREDIRKNKQYYFINYQPKYSYGNRWMRNDFFEEFLSDYKWSHWDATNEELKTFLGELMSYLQRPLTDAEKEYIQEDYFEKDSLKEDVDFYSALRSEKESRPRYLQMSQEMFEKSGLNLTDYLLKKVKENIPHPFVRYAIVDGDVRHLPLYFEKKNLLFRKYKELEGKNEFFPDPTRNIAYMKPFMVDLQDIDNPKII